MRMREKEIDRQTQNTTLSMEYAVLWKAILLNVRFHFVKVGCCVRLNYSRHDVYWNADIVLHSAVSRKLRLGSHVRATWLNVVYFLPPVRRPFKTWFFPGSISDFDPTGRRTTVGLFIFYLLKRKEKSTLPLFWLVKILLSKEEYWSWWSHNLNLFKMQLYAMERYWTNSAQVNWWMNLL